MKPAPFKYVRVDSVAAALGALDGDPDAAVLAGGQSLLAMMNMRAAQPRRLIDINGIAELSRFGPTSDGRFRIGALVRHAVLETDPAIASAAPLLVAAARELAHPAIRNRGTLGGSLALADPAAELPACALALGALIEITGAGGAREIPANDFFLGPFATALGEGEILTALILQSADPDVRFAYRKLARRHGDFALAGVAATDGQGGLRIAVFGVGDKPVLATHAAAALAEGGAVDAAVRALGRDVAPDDLADCSGATRLHLAGVALRRALADLGR